MKTIQPPQSGSQADTVASRNRFGQYYRTRAMPTQPRTVSQVARRAALGQLSSTWRTLTSTQMAAWAAYAAAHPRVDSLGQVIILTGHQMYISVNAQLQSLGQAGVPDAPDGTVVNPPAVSAISAVSGDITGTWDNSVTGSFMGVFAGPPRSAGVSFEGQYVLMGAVTGNSTTPPAWDFGTQYLARFGTPTAGKKIFLRFTAIDLNGNQSGETKESVLTT